MRRKTIHSWGSIDPMAGAGKLWLPMRGLLLPRLSKSAPCKCCTSTSCNLCVTAYDDCSSSAPLVGATITVAQGSTTIGTCQTAAAGTNPGQCCIPVPASGTYSVTVSKTNYRTVQFNYTVNCPGQNNVSAHMVLTSRTVQQYLSMSFCGPTNAGTISLAGPQGETITQSTNTNGGAYFTLSAPGSYTATFTPNYPRIDPANLTFNVPSLCTSILPSHSVSLSASAGYDCITQSSSSSTFCVPCSKNVTLTDSVWGGPVTLTNPDVAQGCRTNTCVWTSNPVTYPYPSLVNGTVQLIYKMSGGYLEVDWTTFSGGVLISQGQCYGTVNSFNCPPGLNGSFAMSNGAGCSLYPSGGTCTVTE